MEKKEMEIIDLRVIFSKIWAKRKIYYIVLPIVFILSCAYILCIPRTYSSNLSLAPELSNNSNLGGTIGSLASSFGIDIGNMETSDAINPMLYPDLMEDNGFVVGLFNIKVATEDGSVKCSYYDYLTKHQDYPFWTKCFGGINKLFEEKNIYALFLLSTINAKKTLKEKNKNFQATSIFLFIFRKFSLILVKVTRIDYNNQVK